MNEDHDETEAPIKMPTKEEILSLLAQADPDHTFIRDLYPSLADSLADQDFYPNGIVLLVRAKMVEAFPVDSVTPGVSHALAIRGDALIKALLGQGLGSSVLRQIQEFKKSGS